VRSAEVYRSRNAALRTPQRSVPTASVAATRGRDGALRRPEVASRNVENLCMKFVPRTQLPHDAPFWIDTAKEIFFVTICCAQRGVNQLALPAIATALIETIEHRNERGSWYVHIAVFMPDHVHMLVSIPPDANFRNALAKWKEWTAKKLGIRWQRDFFEHRLRGDESFAEKADYILANPVRAGFVSRADDWAFRYIADAQDGTGAPRSHRSAPTDNGGRSQDAAARHPYH